VGWGTPFLGYHDSMAILYGQWCTPMGLQSRPDTDALSSHKGHGQYPPLSPKLPDLSLSLSLCLSPSLSLLSHFIIFYVTLTLLYILLSLPSY
jgi:hypothetical protein